MAMDTAFFSSGTKPERQPGDSPTPLPRLKTGGEGVGETIPRCRRLFHGKPMTGDCWSVVVENDDWLLQVGPPSPDSAWRSLKLSSKKPLPYGANYWFGWDGCRMARGSEIERLRERDPDLVEWVALTLEAFGV